MLLHRDLVRVTPGFKAAINLDTDWDDQGKIAAYIPTRFALRMLHEIAGALRPGESSRIFNIHGPYGVGKSHLGLTIAAYLRQPFDDGWLGEFFQKTKAMDVERTADILRDRTELPAPMLVVRLYGSDAPTREALLHALDEALQREGLSDLRPETTFSAAIARIQEIEDTYSASMPVMADAFRSVGYESLEAMKGSLAAYKADALNAFARVHPRFSSGAPFGQHHGQNPGDVFRGVALKLQREPGGRKRAGIAVLWDEFTLHAEKVMADPTGRQYMDLQHFLEACSGSGTARLIFLSLSHRSILQVVAAVPGLDPNQREALNKVAGRFNERAIRQEEGEQYRLIGRVLIPIGAAAREELRRHHAGYYAGLEARISALKLFPSLSEEQMRSIAFQEVYPLHPAVLYLLPLLSERVAQNDRTLFHFLADSGPDALPSFLTAPVLVDEHPNLLPVDRLFAYFAEAIAAARQEEIRVVYSRYRRLRPLPESQQRLVNTLLLLQVGRAPQLPPTAVSIGFALGYTTSGEFAALQEELEVLKRTKVLREGPDGLFEIRRLDQEVDFDESLEVAERDVSDGFDVLSLVKQWTSRARVGVDIRAASHNKRFKADRGYEPVVVTPDHLRIDRYKSEGIPHDATDGVAYWVVAMTEQELAEAQQYAETFTNARILIVLPREPLGLLADLRTHLAIKQLEKVPAFGQNGLQRDEWERASEELQKRIRDQLAYCFMGGTAYVGGMVHHYPSADKLEQIAGEGMDMAFPLSLTIPHERLVASQGSDTQRQYRQPVLEVLLDKSKDLGQFLEHAPAPSRLIVQAVLQENGWLRREGGGWELGSPDPNIYPAGSAVWQVIEQFIRDRKSKPAPFTFLISVLSEPPYGVRPRVLPVLLAATFRSFINSLEFYEGGGYQPVEPSSALVERIAKEPGKVTVRFAAITDQQYYLLEAVMDGISSMAPLSEKNPVGQVGSAIGRRAQRIAGLARATGQLPPQIVACRDRVYLPLVSNLGDDHTRSLLFDVLPGIAGIPDLRNSSRSAIRDGIVPLLQKLEQELSRVSDRLLLPVVASMLGCEADPETVTANIANLIDRATPERTAKLYPKQLQILTALRSFHIEKLEASVSQLAQALLPRFAGLTDEVLGQVQTTGSYALGLLLEELTKPLAPPPGENPAAVKVPTETVTPEGLGAGGQQVVRDPVTEFRVHKDPTDLTKGPDKIAQTPKPVEPGRQTIMEVKLGDRTRLLDIPSIPNRNLQVGIQAVRAGLNRPGLGQKEKVEILAVVLSDLLRKES